MEYRITCVCGHSFELPEEKLTGQVNCPACGQRLTPVVDKGRGAAAPAAAGGAAGGVAAEAEPTKRCPFCGEVILAIARKCKHCGEFLDRGAPGEAGPVAAIAPNSTDVTATPAVGAPTPSAPANAADVPAVFTVSTSQWDNFWRFIVLLLVVLAFAAGMIYIPIAQLREYAPVAVPGVAAFAFLIGWYFFLAAHNTRYYIRPTRIDAERGILSKNIDSLDLFRIVDVDFRQSFIERMLGIGTIQLTTTEDKEPELILYQIPRAREVLKYIQAQIPIAAKMRGAVYMEK